MATSAQQQQWAALDVDHRIALVKFLQHGTIAPDQINQIIHEWAAQNFGALAAFLDVPEVGALIEQAAQNGWTQQRLQIALNQTNWWKTTTDAQRQFDALKAEDPATAQKNIDQAKASVTQLLSQEGVLGQYTDDRITALATDIVRNGVPSGEVPKFALAQAQYNPATTGGGLDAQATQIKNLAYQYGLPITDQQAFDQAKQVEMGTQTQQGAQDFIKNQAKAAYGSDPYLAAQIDAGHTVRDVLNPQIATAANLLGVDPNTIDIRDPKYASILQYQAAPGDPPTVATVDQTAKLIKQSAAWRSTDNATASAASFAESLSKTFGAVA